jgi:RHS repeat-associated protein
VTVTRPQSWSNIVHYNPYQFAGGLADSTSTLMHYGMRWYDPVTGRWTQQDSLETLADPSRANRYEYAGGNPANYVDPTGRDFWDFIRHVGASTVTGIWTGFAGGCVAGLLAGPPGCGAAGTLAAVGGAAAGLVGGVITYFQGE